MNARKLRTLFISAFVLLIVSVGGYQAWVEWKSHIQAGYLIVDSFKTPLTRYNNISGKIAEIKELSANSNPDFDEMSYLFKDMQNLRRQINRYVSLNDGHIKKSNQQNIFESLNKSIQNQDKNGISGNIETLESEYSSLSFFKTISLWFQAIFKETLFNAEYLRAYEKEMEDNSKIALWAREGLQYVNYHLLGETGDKAVPGEKDWFFYKQGVDYLTKPYFRNNRLASYGEEGAVLMEDPIKAIEHFKNQLEEKGIELLIVIAPGKASIYPDLLNDNLNGDMQKIAAVSKHTKKFLAELKERGIETVNLHEPFLRERERDSELNDYVYLARDTHWKPRGLELAAKIVADKIKNYSWFEENKTNTEYATDSIRVSRTGDITDMTKLEFPTIKSLKIEFSKEDALCNQVFKLVRDSSGEEISRQLYKDDFRNSRILVLGDSFSRIFQTDTPRSAGWISHLAKELSEPLASIVNNGGASTLVRKKLSRKKNILKGKKLVVWEFVERDIQFGAEGWKDVEL